MMLRVIYESESEPESERESECESELEQNKSENENRIREIEREMGSKLYFDINSWSLNIKIFFYFQNT